jgi:hypothetical protein
MKSVGNIYKLDPRRPTPTVALGGRLLKIYPRNSPAVKRQLLEIYPSNTQQRSFRKFVGYFIAKICSFTIRFQLPWFGTSKTSCSENIYLKISIFCLNWKKKSKFWIFVFKIWKYFLTNLKTYLSKLWKWEKKLQENFFGGQSKWKIEETFFFFNWPTYFHKK